MISARFLRLISPDVQRSGNLAVIRFRSKDAKADKKGKQSDKSQVGQGHFGPAGQKDQSHNINLKTDSPGFGAASSKGHDGSGAFPKPPPPQQQQKRSLTTSTWLSQISRGDSGKQSGEKPFVSDSAAKNIDPKGSSNQQSSGENQQKNAKAYKPQDNPSEFGKKQDEKYLEEALSGKSGPLTGGNQNSTNRKDHEQPVGGKRHFSTSAAANTTMPSGRDKAPGSKAKNMNSEEFANKQANQGPRMPENQNQRSTRSPNPSPANTEDILSKGVESSSHDFKTDTTIKRGKA